jgi:hypothetical protein
MVVLMWSSIQNFLMMWLFSLVKHVSGTYIPKQAPNSVSLIGGGESLVNGPTFAYVMKPLIGLAH